MACFVTPTATAIVTTCIGKKAASKYHFEWLNTMLWGGAAMLLVEHVARGEVVFYPPFFTGMGNPANAAALLKEIIIVGGAMTAAIVAVWWGMAFIANSAVKLREKKIQSVTA